MKMNTIFKNGKEIPSLRKKNKRVLLELLYYFSSNTKLHNGEITYFPKTRLTNKLIKLPVLKGYGKKNAIRSAQENYEGLRNALEIKFVRNHGLNRFVISSGAPGGSLGLEL